MTVLAIETRDELLALRHSHFVLQSFHIFCDKFGSMRSTIQLDAGVLVGGNLFNTSLHRTENTRVKHTYESFL